MEFVAVLGINVSYGILRLPSIKRTGRQLDHYFTVGSSKIFLFYHNIACSILSFVHLNISHHFHFRVWSVRYNHFHDQLVLTSSSDSRVILNNIVSLSSEPFGHLDDEDEEDGAQDKGSV